MLTNECSAVYLIIQASAESPWDPWTWRDPRGCSFSPNHLRTRAIVRIAAGARTIVRRAPTLAIVDLHVALEVLLGHD